MKKKLIFSVLACLMVLALLACTAAPTPSNSAAAPASSAAPAASVAAATSAAAAPASESAGKKLKIGYIITFAEHEWYQNQLKGSQDTAKELGYDFISADAKNDQATEISVGENLLAQNIDVLIMAPVDAKGALPLIQEAQKQGVKVVTTSVLAPQQDLYVGITDKDGGVALGKYAGQYVKDHNLPTPKALLVGLPALQACVDRTEGFKQGMLSIIPDAKFIDVDGGGSKDTAMPKAQDALTANPDVNMIMGINDDSALGGYQAFKAAGMDESKLTVWGFGCEGVAAKNELTNTKSAYKGSLAMFPEYFGRLCVLAARDLLAGKIKDSWIAPPIMVMTPDNLSTYYTKSGDNWNIIWPPVEKLGYATKAIPALS